MFLASNDVKVYYEAMTPSAAARQDLRIDAYKQASLVTDSVRSTPASREWDDLPRIPAEGGYQ
jgi:hypothetical protein